MPQNTRRMTAMILCATLIMNLQPFVPGSSSGAAPPPDDGIDGLQYTVGTWYVNDTQVYTDEEIVHTGDIIINSGGTLTLVNTLLRMNCTVTADPLWIKVLDGGSLNIWDKDGNPGTDDGSLITDGTYDTDDRSILDYRYYFRVDDGAALNINCSAVEECGWYDTEEHISTWGPYIKGDGAVISNATFTSCGMGVILNGSAGTLIDHINGSVVESLVFGLDANGTIVRNSWINGTSMKYGIVLSDCSDVRIHHNVNITANFESVRLTRVNDSYVAHNFMDQTIQMSQYKTFYAYQCGYLRLYRNNITSSITPFELNTCANVTVEEEVFMATSVKRGQTVVLMVWESENITIEKARMWNHNYDVYGHAMHIYNSKFVNILNCTLDDTRSHGIYVQDSSDFLIDNCTLRNCSGTTQGRGLYISGSHNGEVSNCLVEYSYRYEIMLSNSDNVQVVDNRFGGTTTTQYGLYVSGDNNYAARNELVHYGRTAIYHINGDGNVYVNNTIRGFNNQQEGVRLYGDNNLLKNTTISDHYWGLMLFDGSRAENVNVSSCSIGIQAYDCVLDNVSSYDNVNYGLEVHGDPTVAMNCSFTSNGNDIIVTQNTNLTLINCTYDAGTVLLSNPSDAYRKWWVEVLVNDTKGIVPGALVSVYNNFSVLEWQGQAGPDGRVLMPVTDVRVFNNGTTHIQSWNNHTISAFLYPATAWVTPAPNVTANTKYTLTFPGDTNPAPPYDITATGVHGDVNVTWDYPDLPDLKRYEVFRSEDPDNFDFGTVLGTAPDTQKYYVDAGGASDWKTYYYVVRAVDDAENDGNASEAARCGDWMVVDGAVSSASDRSILLNGSLVVEEGGNLTLSKVRLAFNNSVPGESGVTVGGVLEITDLDDDSSTAPDASNISTSNGSNPTYFTVEDSGRLYMNNSVAWGIGYTVGAPGNHQAIYIGGDGSVVRGCDIYPTQATYAALSVHEADDVQLVGNRIHGSKFLGITIIYAENCTISENDVNDTDNVGISVYESGNCTVANNTATNCSAGIGLYSAWDSVVKDNYARYNNVGGIEVVDCVGIDILNNTAADQASKTGLSVQYCPDSRVGQNTVFGNRWGLVMRYSTDSEFFENDIYGNSDLGAELGSNVNLITWDNQVHDNTLTGMGIKGTSTIKRLSAGEPTAWSSSEPAGVDPIAMNNTFSGDTVYGNTYGIEFDKADGITLEGLNVTDNTVGLYFHTSGLVDVIDTDIVDNLNYAVSMEAETPPPAYEYNLRLENCTLSGSVGGNLELDDISIVECINTTVPHETISFKDTGSMVIYRWYLSVYVEDQFGDPAENSTVYITNSKVTNIPKGSTGADGYLRWLLLHERTALSSGNITYNPFTFDASLGNHSGENASTVAGPGVINITLENDPPTVIGLSILPLAPVTTQDINISFGYDDDENDPEFPPLIKWFRNGIEVPSLEDEAVVPKSQTARGQTWFARVWVYDGADYSDPDDTDVITIQNTQPEASDVLLSPGSVSSTGDLSVAYNYSDVDGDNEGDSLVRWYRDQGSGFEDAGVTGTTLSHSHTKKGDKWMAKVQPHDGDEYGDQVDSTNIVTIGNTAPSLTAAPTIEPGAPTSSEDITVDYTFQDPDGDVESGSTHMWYVDRLDGLGFVDSSLTGETVEAQYLIKGQMWKVRVTPSDGTNTGTPLESGEVTIGNTAPALTGDINFTPVKPKVTDNIEVSYEFNDADGDTDKGTSFRWYVDEPGGDATFVYSGIDGNLVPSSALTKGQRWKCEITPSDGETPGSAVLSTAFVEVVNSAPTVSKLQIEPLDARAGDSLTAAYEFHDDDGDAESGTSLKWFRSGIYATEYDNMTELPKNVTVKNETWYFTVLPSDGDTSGAAATSPLLKISGNVTIRNTPPEIFNVTLLPKAPITTDPLEVSYEVSDFDGDEVRSVELQWYKHNIHVGSYDGLSTLDSLLTVKGDIWQCRIRVSDGEHYSGWADSNTVLIQNSRPTLTVSPANPEVTITENDTVSFNVTVADLDGDLLTCYYYVDPYLFPGTQIFSAISGQPISASFTWGYDSSTVYAVRVEVSDGSGGIEEFRWNVTVGNLNRQPDIESWEPETADIRIVGDRTMKFSIGATDPDGPDPDVEWFVDGELVGTGSEYVLDSALFEPGEHEVTAVVTDGDEQTSRTWTVDVKEEAVEDVLMGRSYDWWGLVMAIISAIATAIIAMFGFLRMRKKKGKLRIYMLKIDGIRMSETTPGEKEERLLELKGTIKEEFSDGLIEENHYIILERACDDAIRESRKAIFTSGFNLSPKLEAEVDEALEDGVVTEEEYRALEKKIFTDDDMSPEQKRELGGVLARWAREDDGDDEAAPGKGPGGRPPGPAPGMKAGDTEKAGEGKGGGKKKGKEKGKRKGKGKGKGKVKGGKKGEKAPKAKPESTDDDDDNDDDW